MAGTVAAGVGGVLLVAGCAAVGYGVVYGEKKKKRNRKSMMRLMKM